MVVADAFTAFVCFAIASSYLQSHSRHHIGFFTAVLVAAATSAPLLLRTRFPLISWAAAALTIVGTTVLIRRHLLVTEAYLPTSVLVYGLCLYSVTVRCKVRIVAAAAIVTVVGGGVHRLGRVRGGVLPHGDPAGARRRHGHVPQQRAPGRGARAQAGGARAQALR